MKTIGRISLIFMICVVCFAGGAYLNSVYTKWFYPNQYEKKQFQEYAQEEEGSRFAEGALGRETENGNTSDTGKDTAADSGINPGTNPENRQGTQNLANPEGIPAQEVSTGRVCTDCDTSFVIMKYDMQTKTTQQEETEIPAKYMGMTREKMQEAIAMYVAAPPLSELNQGFVTAELVSFSPEKVVIKKSYQKETPPEEFIILAEQNYVTVYRNDMETVYLYTDIRLEDLPPEVQQEVIRQKFVGSEEELYNFLESYSS